SSGSPAPQNVAKSSIDLNGPPQRLPLLLATGFVLLIHIFHIIPQVVRSFNVAESHCNLKSASNGLLRNTWNVKVILACLFSNRKINPFRTKQDPPLRVGVL